jgi:thiol-disulfide isomerase/thioredoxin
MKEIHAINSEWEQTILKAADTRRNAKSPLELERAKEAIATTERRLVERCLVLASRQPGGVAGLIALKMVACRSSKTEEGKKAAEALIKQAASADLGVLAKALPWPVNVSEEPVHSVAPIILERVKKDPAHAQAPGLLASVVCGSADLEAAKPPAEFKEAADLIVERYAESPEVELTSLGKPAPEIDGVALDGRGMKLSDYRGKVVLLSFWATWCGPCMKMVPQERELVKRFEGKPFVLVGVNGDDDQKTARAAVADHGMTWRSFQNKDGPRTISLDWHVWGWPTFYLIDQKGIVRKRRGDTGLEELNLAIDQLLDAEPESKTLK